MVTMKQLGIGVVAFAVMLAGCAPPEPTPASAPERGSQGTPSAKKRITAAISGEPFTLSSIIDSAGVGSTPGVTEMEELYHVGLAEVVDYRVAVRPRLAESIPSLDNGAWKTFPDGRMETTWRIRRDARWHDGTPLTSADLLFTVQVGQDRDLAVLSHNAYRFIEGVEATDSATVVVRWTRPFILADTMFSGSFALPVPRHILEPIYLDQKENFAEHPYWTEEFVGTGPFKVVEFVKGSHLVLTAFEQYVLGRPKLDEIEIKFVNDPSVTVANILAGTIDLTFGRGFGPEQAFEAERQWLAGKVDATFGTSWTALYPRFIDPKPPVMANLQFRRALMHATDRQQVVDSFAMGKSRAVSSFIGPNAPEFPEIQGHIVEYPYDQRRAHELITGLGYVKGPDGMFADSAGRPITMEIQTITGDQLRTSAMFSTADMWKAVGVATETVMIPRQRVTDREWRVTLPGFELVHQPNSMNERALQRFQTKEIPTAQNGYRGNNRALYSNPEYDALAEKYVVTLDARERLELAKQINRHISEQLPALGLLYRVELMLVANRLANVNAEQGTRNAHDWDVK
jgi:peptide/nickel transport system substrate-binding protein